MFVERLLSSRNGSLCYSHYIISFILSYLYEIDTSIIPVFQVRKMALKKYKQCLSMAEAGLPLYLPNACSPTQPWTASLAPARTEINGKITEEPHCNRAYYCKT